MRVLVAGASAEPICGTRDSARTLAHALGDAGAEIATVWWNRGEEPLTRWLSDVAHTKADVVLWHYSPFTWATRGVPVHVPRALRALRTNGAPVVTFFHELMFPWGSLGARGAIHASSQRLALVPILWASRAGVVTTEDRLAWLRRRTALPLLFTPVVSNIPSTGVGGTNGAPRIGVFGFRRERVPASLVAQAVARVPDARLVLVGAPGPDAAEAEEWRGAAAAAGVPVDFTGILTPPALSEALASLDVVVFPDTLGPTTRRGTLAAALAHAKPVVAFDGEQTWSRFVSERALDVVPQSPDALGERLRTLALDDELRAAQSRRAAAFHDRWLDPDVVAGQLLDFLQEVVDG